MRPYVVRFVSQRSGAGKTLVASRVVEALVKAGYSVGVIKHSASGISLEEKDSARYLRAGAKAVLVASRELVLLYSKTLTDDLSELVKSIDKPLVIVEGFRDSRVGDVVIVAESVEDVAKALGENTIAVVLSGKSPDLSPPNVGNVPVIPIDKVDVLPDMIIKRAVEHFVEQLPGLDCGICGLDSCGAMSMKILRGERRVCPVVIDVKLTVNDQEVPLNPFVKSVIGSVIEGILTSLKGVPYEINRVRIEVDKSGTRIEKPINLRLSGA